MAALRPVGPEFFDAAAQRFSQRWLIDQPASAVWDELTGDTPLHWCRGLDIDWTSSRPFGVGTTRQAKVLGGVLRVQERFFLWEEGHRYAFCGTEVNLPLFESLAEDYRVDPLEPGKCAFTWTVGITPTTLGKAGAALNGPLFSRFFSDTAKHFAGVPTEG